MYFQSLVQCVKYIFSSPFNHGHKFIFALSVTYKVKYVLHHSTIPSHIIVRFRLNLTENIFHHLTIRLWTLTILVV